ncbi:MAG: hypothetical protein ABR977_14195, partial [Candidatus Dormibacteria bacterium]
ACRRDSTSGAGDDGELTPGLLQSPPGSVATVSTWLAWDRERRPGVTSPPTAPSGLAPGDGGAGR